MSRFFLGIMFLLTIPLYAVSTPAPKIHVFLDFSANNNNFATQVERGLRIGFDGPVDKTGYDSAEKAENATSVASAPTVTYYDILTNLSTFPQVVVSHIPRELPSAVYPSAYTTAASDSDTLAIIVSTSSQASNAGTTKGTDVLTVGPAATSSILMNRDIYPGMLLIAPPNKIQAKAMFSAMKDNGVTNFAVIYEPHTYGIDLYANIMAEFASESYKNASDAPKLLTALPLHDIYFEDSAYQTIVATRVMIVIKELVGSVLDPATGAVVYCGGRGGFKKLMAKELSEGASASTSTFSGISKWYGSDELYDTPVSEKLGITAGNIVDLELQITMMGVPNKTDSIIMARINSFRSKYGDYYEDPGEKELLYSYLGYDTARYLMYLIDRTAYLKRNDGGLTRENILQIAVGNQNASPAQPPLLLSGSDTTYSLLTGDKGFGASGKSGSFTVYKLDKNNIGEQNEWEEVKAYDINLD